MNLDDIEIESHDAGDEHWEVALMWTVEWPDGPLPPELMDAGLPARPVWVARRKAAGRLARVLAASLEDLETTRTHHRCGPPYTDRDTPGCRAWASEEVLRPFTSDQDLNRHLGRDHGWGDIPMVSITVPPGEADQWVARLTERLKAVCADDQAMPAPAADAEPQLLRTTLTERAKETP